jgi:tyrosine-protein kinase Etk/Wzc
MNDVQPELVRNGASELTLLDVFMAIVENVRLLVVAPFFIGLIALSVAFLIPPKFTATIRILPPQQQQGAQAALASQLTSLSSAGLLGGLNIKNPADIYMALLKSRTVADGLINRFDLMNVYEVSWRQDAREYLAEATKVSTARDGLVTIEVEDKDPKRSAALANAYVEELDRLTASLAITEAQQRRLFFKKELEQTQRNLKNSELALGQVGAGESLLNSAPQTVVEGIARLKAQVTAHEIRVSTMRGYLTESSPQFQLAMRELDSLRAQLSQAERSHPAKAMAGSDYLNRFRDFKYQETLFELMAKQYELARLDEAREGVAIQVVDPALVPERKSKPKRGLIAVVATLASGLALLIFLLIRQWLRIAEHDKQLAAKLTRLRRAFRPFGMKNP